MPPHSLVRPLRQLVSIGQQKPCATCKCNCGRALRPHVLPLQQRRAFEPRPNVNPYAESRLRKQYKKEVEEFESTRHYKLLEMAKTAGLLKTSVDNALGFVNEFTQLDSSQRRRKGVGVDVGAFDTLLKKFTMPLKDCVICSRMLLHDNRKSENKHIGKSLLYTLSHWGYPHATIQIMQEALLEAKSRPEILKSSELTGVRQQLSHMAMTRTGYISSESFIPMVMEGKVQYVLGNVDAAITLWTESIGDAVILSEEDRKRLDIETRNSPLVESVLSPWVELTQAFLRKGDFDKAKWAIAIGCDQDDPTSHYSAAVLEQRTTQGGEHITTSSWLYHMLKAGGAGHVKAAHALGNWYASSGWKYIEDEPPDNIKPTPFDSYPPDASSETVPATLWEQLGTAIGLRRPPEQNPNERLFLIAAFPSSPYDRYKMAMQWLEVSMGTMYAPSYLLAARLLLEQTLWPLAAAPKEALELSERRYTYASKSDYEAGVRIDQLSEGDKIETQDISNPGYDPDRAKELIREVFYAAQALASARKLIAASKPRSRGRNINTQDVEDSMEEDMLPTSWSGNIRKWFRFPEAREMYMNDSTGILYDDELKVDLEVTARQICDEQEWDIYDEEGGLMYRHGMR